MKEIPEHILFSTRAEWDSWLEKQHNLSTGIWLRIAKKNSGILSVSYDEALETALCYGWIDARKGSLDDNSWLQRFTPRKAGSKWSKINREKAERLIESGRIFPPGLAAIEISRKNGNWDLAYQSQRTIQVPEDLEIELQKSDEARAFFNQLDSANRYAILYRIQTASKPETRRKWVEKLVIMLKEKRKIH